MDEENCWEESVHLKLPGCISLVLVSVVHLLISRKVDVLTLISREVLLLKDEGFTPLE